MRSTSSSPPTRRVIDVMEYLIRQESHCTTTQLAETLKIARPTAGAILRELEAAGWIRRDEHRAYAAGHRFASAGHLVGHDDVRAVLESLATRLDCGLTLSRVNPDQLVVVDKVQGPSRTIRGLPMGAPVALRYPTGAAVMAWRSPSDQGVWLAGAGAVGVRDRRALLRSAKMRGVVLYRPEHHNSGLLDVLVDLLDAAGADGQRRDIQQRVHEQIGRLVSRTYTDTDIDDPAHAPLSYLTAAVFDAGDHARYELQVAPLRSDVTHDERQQYIAATRQAAHELRGIE